MDMLDRKIFEQQQEAAKHKQYILYCPKVYDKSGKGFNKFQEEYKEGEGNYLPHLEAYGKFLKWYQIVDTKDNNKVVSEHFREDDNDDEEVNIKF